jgi:hypothetical protein
MHPEQEQPYEASQEPNAGKSQLERSGNWDFPATPPEDPGVPQPATPPELGNLAPDEMWEDAWPREGVDVEHLEADEVSELPDSLSWGEEVPPPVVKTRRRGTLAPGVERPQLPITPQQKLLLLDTWQRSGLPARDFSALVNISHHTLYSWKKRFEELGPAGLRPVQMIDRRTRADRSHQFKRTIADSLCLRERQEVSQKRSRRNHSRNQA